MTMCKVNDYAKENEKGFNVGMQSLVCDISLLLLLLLLPPLLLDLSLSPRLMVHTNHASAMRTL